MTSPTLSPAHSAVRSLRPGFLPELSLAVAALLVVGLSGCGSQAAPGSAMPAPPVSVARVLEQPVQQWDEYTGRIEAVTSVELRPRVSGYVDRIAFEEGEEVRKGELLFVIDPRPYQATLAQAEANLERARSEARLARAQHERAQSLVEAQAISREEAESRRATAAQGDAAVRAAEAAVATARLDLQFTRVTSPIDGRAGRALVTVGNLAQSDATVLTTVVSLDPVHVHFEGDEQTFLGYRELVRSGDRADSSNPVRVGLAGEEGYPHEGVVDFVDNRVDPATGTIELRAVLPNPDRVFTPGLFARVQLLGREHDKALLVDHKAVLTDQDRTYVYVLGKDNAAVRKDVELGGKAGGLRVVTAGLEAGDRVIVHGVQKVFHPGMQVAPRMIAMGAPPASDAAGPAGAK